VHDSSYEYTEFRGWQLPDRAKHKAIPGDIFIGSVWGSVKKWFIAGAEAQDGNLIVTNGFLRLRVKPEQKHRLPDLIFALSSEFYRVQMRALATGSDGSLCAIMGETISFKRLT
jgi:type I restriction enzyme M protein